MRSAGLSVSLLSFQLVCQAICLFAGLLDYVPVSLLGYQLVCWLIDQFISLSGSLVYRLVYVLFYLHRYVCAYLLYLRTLLTLLTYLRSNNTYLRTCILILLGRKKQTKQTKPRKEECIVLGDVPLLFVRC